MAQKSLNQTYLFNNVEVKLTGRYTSKIRTRNRQDVQIIVYEVQPVDEFNGDWKKWAAEDELLEIQNMENDSE